MVQRNNPDQSIRWPPTLVFFISVVTFFGTICVFDMTQPDKAARI